MKNSWMFCLGAVVCLLFSRCNNGSEGTEATDSMSSSGDTTSAYLDTTTATADTSYGHVVADSAASPSGDEDRVPFIVTGVGIANGSEGVVTFYLSRDGNPPYREFSLGPGEADDFHVVGQYVYIVILSSGQVQPYRTRLSRWNRYHIVFHEEHDRWEVQHDGPMQ